MAAKTIMINNKYYYLHRRDHREGNDSHRSVTTGLTGKSIVQDFGFTKETLDVTLLVYLNPPNADFGSVDDLKAAYALIPVSVVDVDGTERDMIFLDRLDLPRDFALVDPSVPFRVACRLEKFYP